MWSANSSNRKLFQICLSQLYMGHLIVCFCVFLSAAFFMRLQKGCEEGYCREKGVCMLNFFFLLHNINLYVLIIEVFPFKVSHLGMYKHIKKLCPFLIFFPLLFSLHFCCLNELTQRMATIQLSHEQHFVLQTWIRFKIPSWAIIPTVWPSVLVFVATFAYSFAAWADLPQLWRH